VSTGAKVAIGVVVVLVLVVVVWLIVWAATPRPRNITLRVGGTRPADAVFTPDSAGRFPGEEGWVDEGADVAV